MEGSSESGWQEPDSSGGLNSSFPSRSPGFFGLRTVILPDGNASHDSDLVSLLKGRGVTHWPELSRERNDIFCGDGVESTVHAVECGEVSLRQWLDDMERTVDALECVHIFSQIVHIVKLAHSEGIMVRNVRPSCFVMSSLNRVSFIDSASSSDTGSDSLECAPNSPIAEFKGGNSSLLPHVSHSDQCLEDERGSLDIWLERNRNTISQINSEMSCLQSCSGQATHAVEIPEDEHMDENKHFFPMKRILQIESSWYTSPEEVSAAPSCASDIYQLGVLLFELFCTFNSWDEKIGFMGNLRHRLLPPHMLLSWPKEASLCLWLLHPEPSCRPNIDEILQCEYLNEPRSEIQEREAAIDVRDKLEEQDALLEFLLQLQKKKQAVADSLKEIISIISSDIEEVSQLQATHRIKYGEYLESSNNLATGGDVTVTENSDSDGSFSRKRTRQVINNAITKVFLENEDVPKILESPGNQVGILSTCSRLMSNFQKLESAYYLTRQRAVKPASKLYAQPYHAAIDGKGFAVAADRMSVRNQSLKEKYNDQTEGGWMSTFLEGLCKYLTFNKVNVKADLNQGDLLNSSNLVCSLSFDRGGEYFATAGVNKKIKIFEYNSILSMDRDIHYPIAEMSSKSKLSSICWNGYMRNQIASSNFDGVVQVWDVTKSQIFTEMREHQKRVWSVDFSTADPMMLASGGDDGFVKLWNINQGVSASTIQTRANICCVQFHTDSGHSLAFGSADHKIYYYDLRNSKQPLYTLVGHKKTVSYVKFIDSTMLVSASTDNTLKLWDLSMAASGKLDCPVQSYTGHLNVKNFVGLSVSDGYIATGSETNEVFVYHKAFPMPVLSFKFADSVSSNEADKSGVFTSSVCWRGNSSTLIAANSVGHVKLLEIA